MVTRRVAFAVPGDLATPTGGYAYDDRMIRELRALGWHVDVVDIGDGFPKPSAMQRSAALRLLSDVPNGTAIVIDGLALGAIPEVAAELARAHVLVALVHHPLALETGLSADEAVAFRCSERAALATTRKIIASSESTARLLVSDYGVASGRITVASPGVDPVPWSEGGDGGTISLLSVGAIVPRKGYDVLIAALSTLAELPWRLLIAGDRTRSPATAAALDAMIAQAHMSTRIAVPGALSAPDLAEAYLRADVFIMASRYEGYGMAAAAAIAHGLPIIATRAGALAETVGNGGILLAPDDPEALAGALRDMITNPDHRARWRAAARAAAGRLPSWRASAEKIARTIEDLR